MSLCRDFSPTVKEEGMGKAVKGNKMKNQHPVQAVQTTLVSGVLSLVSNWNCTVPSGDPKWKPTVARQSSEVWKEEGWWWGCVILPSQNGVGWDQAWRLLGKCSSNTTRSSYTAVVHGGPHVLRYLQRPSGKPKADRRNMQVTLHHERSLPTHCRHTGYLQTNKTTVLLISGVLRDIWQKHRQLYHRVTLEWIQSRFFDKPMSIWFSCQTETKVLWRATGKNAYMSKIARLQDKRSACLHANNNNANMLIICSNSKLTMFTILMQCITMPTLNK